MVTVTDFDERREVRADRVLELAPAGSGPAGASSARAALDLDPDRQEWAADDLLAAGRW
jgi:hypothetical protein